MSPQFQNAPLLVLASLPLRKVGLRQIVILALALGLSEEGLCAEIIEDAMPPLYRKVSLNGRPSSDPMPHKFPRTDAEPEKTYIDALTLRVTHRTTDIFIPILRDGFALTVNRNVEGSAWIPGHTLTPAQRPDLPFGDCWSSGLAANIHIIERKGANALRASATDEEGTTHEFLLSARSAGEHRYVPVPTSRSEQDWAQMRLTIDASGAFTLRRKFGTTLVFDKDPSARVTVGSGASQERHSFFRLKSVSDRFTSKIEYLFNPSNNGLIPDEIVYGSYRLRIERNESGRVERVIDPSGSDRLYEYRAPTQPGGAPLMIVARSQIVGRTRAVTRYDYEEIAEGKADAPAAYHCNISRIIDPRGKAHEWQYTFDSSRPGPAAWRSIAVSKLPDQPAAARFFNYSRANSSGETSQRMTFIVDAEDHGRLYVFSEKSVESIRADNGASDLAQVTVYRRLTASSFSGSEHEFSEQDQNFRTLGNTGLLAKESYEFSPEAGLALKKAVDLSGNVLAFAYDDSLSKEQVAGTMSRCADPTTFTDALGAVTNFAYEPVFRQLVQTTDAAGRITVNVRHGFGAALTSERVYANAQKLQNGEPFAQTDYEYSEKQNAGFATRKVIRKTGASPEKLAWERDLVTEFSGNALGNILKETADPGGLNDATIFTYDENGNRRSTTYSNGYRIEFKYDAVNRLTRVFRPMQGGGRSAKKLEYDLRGNKIRETEPSGAIRTLEYDGTSRLVRESFFLASNAPKKTERVHEYQFNLVGSRTKGVDEKDGVVLIEYDAMQRATKVTQADGLSEVLRYGVNSGSDLFDTSSFKASSSIAPNGSASEIEYDANYRRKKVTAVSGPGNANRQVFEFHYDPAGNLILEIAPGNRRTTHEYDALNRLIKTTLPDGRTERTLYSSTGLKYATVSASGERKEQAFNAAGEPIEK